MSWVLKDLVNKNKSQSLSKMRIDAHQHFWKYDPVRDDWITGDMGVIRRDFYPADLEGHLRSNGFDGSVAVQASQAETETDFLIELSTQSAIIKGVVGWVDLHSDNLGSRLAHYAQVPVVKGFRHIVQGQPAGFMENPKFIRGVKQLAAYGFTYDLLIYHYQLPEAVEFLRKVEEVPMVLDHLAKPAIKSGELSDWKKQIRELAAFDNISCKISGMVTEADWKNWKEEDFRPYLEVVLEAFGTKRLLYGSDWPVCLVAAPYDRQLSIVLNFIRTLSESEQRSIMGENAKTFYNI